jgi:hypothetical protein
MIKIMELLRSTTMDSLQSRVSRPFMKMIQEGTLHCSYTCK